MVRPVEPEPPEALRRVDQKVKRPDATPDKLGKGRVTERDRQSKGHSEHGEERSTPTDSVEIEQLGEVIAPDTPRARPRDLEGNSDHIDVRG